LRRMRSDTPTLIPVLLALAASVLGAPAAPAAGLTPAEVLDLRHVDAIDLSPDGRLAAYTLTVPRSADEEDGAAWSWLYVQAVDGGPARPFLTGGVNVSSPAFSPDGRFLAFRAKRDGDEETQVWAIPLDGGEAQPLTRHPASVRDFRWSPAGDRLVYLAPEPIPARIEKLEKRGYWPRFYEEDLEHVNCYEVPFVFGEEPAAGARLTEGLTVQQAEYLSDGTGLVLVTTALPLIDHSYMFRRIQRLDLSTGSLTDLSGERTGKLGAVRISPDGRRVACNAAAVPRDHAASQLYVFDLDDPDPAAWLRLTPDDFEGHVEGVRWRDRETLLVLTDEGVWTVVSEVEPGRDWDRRRILLHTEDHGLAMGLPATRPGVRTLLLTGSAPAHPGELFAWKGKGGPVRLTDSNPWLAGRELGEMRVVRYEARDGLRIEGLLTLPPGHVEGVPFPLLVEVHGGPESCYSLGWQTRYSRLGQAAAARGYGIFQPNYRGSTGRGLAFALAAHGDPAGKEYDDVADGIRWLVAQGLADPERIGLYGGSYGGYAANWIGTVYTDLVRAVVSFVGISDLVSKRLLTDIPYEDEIVHMGRPVRESWDLMRERSPVRHAEESRSAFLILHGDSDTRVHPSQSQEMYRALKMSGHPAVRLVYYPGEGHGNRRRGGQWDALHRMLAWFDWYVRDLRPLDGDLPPLDLSDQLELEPDDEG
jgi:dipeptidyl aminopeptidase/acylaminoacyl peptidase